MSLQSFKCFKPHFSNNLPSQSLKADNFCHFKQTKIIFNVCQHTNLLICYNPCYPFKTISKYLTNRAFDGNFSLTLSEIERITKFITTKKWRILYKSNCKIIKVFKYSSRNTFNSLCFIGNFIKLLLLLW